LKKNGLKPYSGNLSLCEFVRPGLGVYWFSHIPAGIIQKNVPILWASLKQNRSRRRVFEPDPTKR